MDALLFSPSAIMRLQQRASGVNVFHVHYKTLALFSAFLLYCRRPLRRAASALYMPAALVLRKSAEILVMAVLGGMGSMFGSVVSATVPLYPRGSTCLADYRAGCLRNCLDSGHDLRDLRVYLALALRCPAY